MLLYQMYQKKVFLLMQQFFIAEPLNMDSHKMISVL